MAPPRKPSTASTGGRSSSKTTGKRAASKASSSTGKRAASEASSSTGKRAASEAASPSVKRSSARSAPKPAAKAESKRGATAKATGRSAPKPNIEERMEGVHGWMAEIERRQGRMTYIGAALAVLALAAAGVAIVLAITTRNDTSSDIDALRESMGGLQQEVKRATESELKSLNETIGSLDERITDLKKAQSRSATEIANLKTDVENLQSQPVAGRGAPATRPKATPTP